ncbi:50S ribosomal protein L11 methyltransferase, partial [Neisseria sp. P0001.S010]
HKKGIDIPQLDGKIHVPFGVFSPLRGEYLDLISQTPLALNIQTAFDIGTGSGVIAAILAKRGIPDIIATDTNPKAIACA